MQVTQPSELNLEQAEQARKLRREFFSGDSDREILAKMDKRLAELEPGEKLVTRVKIGRNDACPCNSGHKFKKCCISKIRHSPAAPNESGL